MSTTNMATGTGASTTTRELARLEGEIALLKSRVAELTKTNSRLLSENERAANRIEKTESTLRLWQLTRAHVPVIGLICDAPDCRSAIGVVGVPTESVDAMVAPCIDAAKAAGWITDGRHVCPTCQKKI